MRFGFGDLFFQITALGFSGFRLILNAANFKGVPFKLLFNVGTPLYLRYLWLFSIYECWYPFFAILLTFQVLTSLSMLLKNQLQLKIFTHYQYSCNLTNFDARPN